MRKRQIEEWTGEFGREYTYRNYMSLEEMEEMYKKRYGVARTEMNNKFIGDLNRDIKILEVGSNIGNQLLCLQRMGFENLYGIELQRYATELSKKRIERIDIIRGSAFNLPYKKESFDMVFTSGLLIHIAPEDINLVLREIYRCSKKYIWGFECYADSLTETNYRGKRGLMWRTDFAKLYLEFPLKLIKEKRFKTAVFENLDSMFLLEKIYDSKAIQSKAT